MNTRADEKQKIIHAPVEDVFGAFSDPKKLAQWWGPNGFTNTINEFDFRNGGNWRHIMHGPDGNDYDNESRFLEVLPNKRITIEHISGHHFILTLEFIPSNDHTLVYWAQLFDTPEHYQEIADFVSEANQQNLDRLERVVMQSLASTSV